MALVSYSDSEDSEPKKNGAPALKLPAPKHAKSTLQKVTDRSNPGKIKVSLPDERSKAQDDGYGVDGPEPPAKRLRLGAEEGGRKNFNSFLPAPKRAVLPNKNGGLKGLGKGVGLKTSATPGFSREAPESAAPNDDTSEFTDQGNDGFDGTFIAPYHVEDMTVKLPDHDITVEVVAKKPALMFKPLSVTRKQAKKKASTPIAIPALVPPQSKPEVKSHSKISLFSMEGDVERSVRPPKSTPDAEPYAYETIQQADAETGDSSYLPGYEESQHLYTSQQNSEQPGAQSLDSIASDLNLSTSARRQLLGRSKQNGFAMNIVNFNTDEEYAANEALRQAGEAQSHNPVRAIASGKHSLKQLVNAAANQKDALEEQFASGRRNKKEAGNKYGW